MQSPHRKSLVMRDEGSFSGAVHVAHEKTVSQADCLEVLQFFQTHGLMIWLHGGWGVEALTGVRREHTDIDIITWETERERFREILGSCITKERSHKLGAKVMGIPVDIVFVSELRGAYVTLHPKLIMTWPKDIFEHATPGKLAGQSVPVINPIALLVEISHKVGKNGYLLEKNEIDRRNSQSWWSQQDHHRARKFFPRSNNWFNRLRLKLGL